MSVHPELNIERYRRHLGATAEWLERSVRPQGGSSAYYAPLLGWSQPYPETTGYLIPTLLKLAQFFDSSKYHDMAVRLGEWLLEIQLDNGAWQGGLYSPGKAHQPSVFNTGQILKGMMALSGSCGEAKWLEAAVRGANWLAQGVSSEGIWKFNDYRSARTPSYYTHVAWPMLLVAKATGSELVCERAQSFLQTVLDRKNKDGSFEDWAFAEGEPAYTHTIAYTLRGLQESSYLVEGPMSEHLQDACDRALEKLRHHAEIHRGRLPGAYRQGWKRIESYTCLTGNAQIAICLLLWEQKVEDLRIVNAAAKLVDNVCQTQTLTSRTARRGGVAGSWPLWQRYMRMRYPNWAAKYHCDAIMRLLQRLHAVSNRHEKTG